MFTLVPKSQTFQIYYVNYLLKHRVDTLVRFEPVVDAIVARLAIRPHILAFASHFPCSYPPIFFPLTPPSRFARLLSLRPLFLSLHRFAALFSAGDDEPQCVMLERQRKYTAYDSLFNYSLE